MSVYKKLNDARELFHAQKLQKTGRNQFAGYDYFTLGDFLVPALAAFKQAGLCAVVSFDPAVATMRIVDVECQAEPVVITSPMGSASLKGVHEVQNIGAVETYQRRYLWMAALEIVEHDEIDATAGAYVPEPKGITAEQFDQIEQLLQASGVDPAAILKWICSHAGTDVPSIEHMPAAAYEPLVKKLNTTIKANAKKANKETT